MTDFTTTLISPRDPAATFATIADVRSWWDGMRMVFALSPHEGGTKVVFTHEGLVPSCECYADCAAGWTHYLDGSLKALLS